MAEDITLQDDQEESLRGKYLTFQLGNEGYGVEIRHVTEIINLPRVTAIPELPHCLRGVINIRGKVIPVMDVRARLHMTEREYDERTSVIVVEVEGKSVGLIVDAVAEVATIPAEQVAPPPSADAGSNYIQGLGKIGEEVKILVDVKALLMQGEMAGRLHALEI